MTDQSDDDDNSAGYGRPPKKHQFKKGQSGCADGGWTKRRANKLAREEKEAKARTDALKGMQDIIKKVALEKRLVRTQAGAAKMPKLEIIVRNVIDGAMRPDASDRDKNRALKLLHHAKLLEPAANQVRGGVLVVYPIRTEEDWERATAGKRLPEDPLHGIPGAEGYLTNATSRGRIPDEDNDT